MLDESRLPNDLADLERRLTSAATSEPPQALRAKVDRRVRAELAGSGRLEAWQFAAAVAAAILILLNFSLSAVARPRRLDGIDRAKVAWLRAELSDLDLGLSSQEIDRQSLLMAAGDELIPNARPYGSTARQAGLSR